MWMDQDAGHVWIAELGQWVVKVDEETRLLFCTDFLIGFDTVENDKNPNRWGYCNNNQKK